MYRQLDRYMEIQKVSQVDKTAQIDPWINKQIHIQLDREIDRQIDAHKHRSEVRTAYTSLKDTRSVFNINNFLKNKKLMLKMFKSKIDLVGLFFKILF